MSRLKVCLFCISIFLIVIQNSLQADESASTITGEDVKEADVDIISIKQNAESNKVNDIESTEPRKEKQITNVTKKDKDATTKEAIDENAEMRDSKRTSKSPLDQLNPGFGENILAPVLRVRTRLGEAVSKGVDGAKDFADGAYNFFKGAVDGLFI